MKIKVDAEKCTGCGLCASIYPEVFEIGEDGHTRVKKYVQIDEKKLKEVIESCPTQGIELVGIKRKRS